MIGPEDLAAGIVMRWTGALVRVICPGGLWYGRVREDVSAPYARLGCTATEIQRLSDRRHLWTFDVKIDVWGDNGPAGDVSRIRTAIENAIAGMANKPIATLAGAIKVVDVRPAVNDLVIEPGVRNADDVCLLTMNWQFKIEGR